MRAAAVSASAEAATHMDVTEVLAALPTTPEHENGSVLESVQIFHVSPAVESKKSIHALHCAGASFLDKPVQLLVQSASVMGIQLSPAAFTQNETALIGQGHEKWFLVASFGSPKR